MVTEDLPGDHPTWGKSPWSDHLAPVGANTHRIEYARFLDLCREGCHTPIGARLWAKTPLLQPNVGAIRRRAPQAAPPALSHIHRRNGICPDQRPAGSWSCSSHADSKTASITEGSWKPLASSSPLATRTRSRSRTDLISTKIQPVRAADRSRTCWSGATSYLTTAKLTG